MLARLKAQPLPILVTALMLLRLVAAARAPLVPDETYYWLWAQHPATGYYDHPPMVAWWIDATSFLGASAFSVRLLFVLSFAALSWLVFDTAKALFGAPVAQRSLLWLNACILLSLWTIGATPDPPSVLMWAGGLWALARLQASGKGWWWLVFGLFAGLGIEAKYTNFFLGLGVVLWVVLDRQARKSLLTPWPYLGAVVAAAAMAPNLMWNAEHHWLTIAKQFGRISPAHFTLKYLIEFLVLQPVLFNALAFVFAVIGAKAWWRNRQDGALTLLVALPLPLVVYMALHVFHDRIQGNWTGPLFPGLVVLAAAGAEGMAGKWLTRIRDWAAPFGIGVSAIALLACCIGNIGPGAGWARLARDIDTKAQAASATWIATVDYDTEGELNYHLRGRNVTAMEERDRYNWPDEDAAHVGQTALIVVPANRQPDLSHCFAGVGDLGTISRGGKSARSQFHLYSGRLTTTGCTLPEPADPKP